MQKDESIVQCADILSTLGCEKSAEQLSIFANMLSLSISKGKSADQLNVIGKFHRRSRRAASDNCSANAILRIQTG